MTDSSESIDLSSRRGQGMLWAGVLLGPLAWLTGFQAIYMLVPWLCVQGHYGLLHLVPVVSLSVCAAGFLMAWRSWQRTGPEWPDQDDRVDGRSRFMAVSGLLLSGVSILLVIAQWIPVFLLDPCQRP